MNGCKSLFLGAGFCAGLFFPLLSIAAETPIDVGVTTAATLVATGTPPDKPQRILEVGTDLVANERLVTSESGRVHLMFRDGSSLTVGPRSDLVLDEYLYDPNAKTGKIVFGVTKGVFRFVGGAISKTTAVQFKTPVATLGIRGGINQFTVDDSGNRITTTHIFGDETTITVPTADGGTETTSVARQEFQATITPGGTISTRRMTADDFTRGNDAFERPENIPLAGLPAAGNVASGPINVPSIEALAPSAGPGLAGFASIPITIPVDISAVQNTIPSNFAPPPSRSSNNISNGGN